MIISTVSVIRAQFRPDRTLYAKNTYSPANSRPATRSSVMIRTFAYCSYWFGAMLAGFALVSASTIADFWFGVITANTRLSTALAIQIQNATCTEAGRHRRRLLRLRRGRDRFPLLTHDR